MRNIKVTVGPLQGASTTNIAHSQSVTGANALVLNGGLVVGGVAILDTPRNILITSGGDDSSISFIVTGTTWANSPVSETLAGTNTATATSLTDFATITSIVTTGTAHAGLKVGTTTTAGSNWVALDEWAFSPIYFQVVVSGTINYTMQITFDNPNTAYGDGPAIPAVNWDSTLPGLLVGQTTSASSSILAIPKFMRILLNSGTGSLYASIGQAAAVAQ